MYDPAILIRGNPHEDIAKATIHMHKDRPSQLGMPLGEPQVLCGHGGYHIYYTHDPKQVNCEACKKHNLFYIPGQPAKVISEEVLTRHVKHKYGVEV